MRSAVASRELVDLVGIEPTTLELGTHVFRRIGLIEQFVQRRFRGLPTVRRSTSVHVRKFPTAVIFCSATLLHTQMETFVFESV